MWSNSFILLVSSRTSGEYCVRFGAVQIKKHVGQSRQATRTTESPKNMAHKEGLKQLGLGNLDRAEGRKFGMI